MKSALDGVTVLDVTGIGPARLAATMLGDMGAAVIKIDLPPGAGSRGIGDGIDYLPTDPLPPSTSWPIWPWPSSNQ